MNFMSPIERALFRYLSPVKQAEVAAFLESLDEEPSAPNECPNCRGVIGDHDSFCDEKCKAEFLDEDRALDAQQPETQINIAGSGMGFRRNAQ